MTIIEVLSNNGCFDFLKDWLRIRSAKKFFWLLCLATFLLSLILDNLTTVCLMLGIVRVLVKEERLRWMFGGAVVITANVAGAITVIGDSNTMLLWIKELVSPIMLTTKLLVPSIIGLAVVLLLISRKLPRTITFQSTTPIYRGDDSLLKRWQRTMMPVAGVGGLCFVPVFHYITLLPPFVGALCVLAFVWMVHELLNSSLLSAGQMSNMRKPLALQYDTLQNILYFLGIYMSLSAVVETGALKDLLVYLSNSVTSTSCLNVTLGLLSAFFGNVCTLITSVSLFAQDSAALNPSFQSYFSVDGVFWPLLSYTTSFGGSLLTIGSVSGFSLMKMEGVTISWYFRHLTFKVLAGWITGLIVFEIIDTGFWLNI
jgi:Na+/H+ antiporter NhaD/arsenite permease-like protein